MARKKKSEVTPKTETYQHPTATVLMRPEMGTQAQFRKHKKPAQYRYDPSLDPALSWDEGGAAREQGEALIREVLEAGSLEEAKAAAAKLKAMSAPFLHWAGKAERPEFEIPTLPLFVHERLSTTAIIDTLKGHKKGNEQLGLFGDPQHSIADQLLKAYEHRDKWINRMILGDSLVVMNSLLHYENMGGQVQMIYMDPPYGVKFGSNFQPFVRKRDVKHNDDDHMTFEPEMVQAYRDTWELGIHSYLTYLRDRLLLCRELLSATGSIFVQINDQNVHHVRELMDEVFGTGNFCSIVNFETTTSQTSELVPSTCDYLVWYAKDRARIKFRELFKPKVIGGEGGSGYTWVELPDGERRKLKETESSALFSLPQGSRLFMLGDLTSQRQGRPSGPGTAMHFEFELDGETFTPRGQRGWTTTLEGMNRLITVKRVMIRK